MEENNEITIPDKVPHLIHGCPKNLHPTHTHGLAKVGLPELFIHGKCYGVVDNANLINMIYVYLFNYQSEWNFIKNKMEIEIPIWDQMVCIRPVDESFAGVRIAFSDNPSETGYAQIYIKNETHVLHDDYFLKEDQLAKDCDGCELQCSIH